MKIIKLIFFVLIVVALIFGGYKVYGLYEQWEAKRNSEIEILRKNQDMFLKKVTELSVTITKVVNDVEKVTTEVKSGKTYEGLKEQILELRKDEEANKEEIAKLREELSERRKAFLASDDTIYIKDKNGEIYLLYRDEFGKLQPASDNIAKIIEHRELSDDVPILPEEEILLDKTKWDIKAGAFYSFDGTYGIIVSKEMLSMWDYTLNASLLLSDIEDFKFAIGADIGYSVRENLELGAGYSTDKEFYVKLQYTF